MIVLFHCKTEDLLYLLIYFLQEVYSSDYIDDSNDELIWKGEHTYADNG